MICVGISGWRYPGWRSVFYPEGLPQRRELEYASRKLSSIEINGTFYSLQRAAYFRQWRAETPDDFVFAVKGSRYITHIRRLREPRELLANFFAQGLLELGPKLGPILWQFSPSFRFDAARIRDFFRAVPRDQRAAAQLASAHDLRVKDPCTEALGDWPVRHAMEVRHRSFEAPEFEALLRELDVALVAADSLDWPCFEAVTADFAYVRLHGAEERYVSGYDEPALTRWAQFVRKWSRGGRHVFVYFDNDAKARAPFDAMRLAGMLGVSP